MAELESHDFVPFPSTEARERFLARYAQQEATWPCSASAWIVFVSGVAAADRAAGRSVTHLRLGRHLRRGSQCARPPRQGHRRSGGLVGWRP